MSSQPHSVLFFCGQPLASRPISQRIATFGAFLLKRGWKIRLTSVDPGFAGKTFLVRDAYTDLDVDAIGVTHYRTGPDGRRIQIPPVDYVRECRRIAECILVMAKDMSAEHIVLSTSLPASMYAAFALRSKHPSVWMDVDDWSAGQFTARGGGQLVGAAYEILERVLPRFAHHITTCSRELQSLHPKSELVPNFIRLREVPVRNRKTAATDRVRVAFASSVTAYHGHAPFLEALVRRRRDCSLIDFWILGDGDSLGECRRIVERGGLGDVVHFSGQLDRAAMLRRLTEADIGVLPLWDNRLNRARFPLKLLDYLACGCTVAASNTGVASDILTHGQTGLLSPSGQMESLIENVLTLAKDADLRTRIATQGMELVHAYDEDVVCERWMSLMTDSRLR